MTIKKNRVAIVFPADAKQPGRTGVEQTRLAGIAEALVSTAEPFQAIVAE